MSESAEDASIRAAAFAHLRKLSALHGHLTSRHLADGFQFRGVRIPLINPQRGIFKPRQLRYLLSIRTVFPRRGARIWYDDQRDVHAQIFESEETVDYAFMGTNPNAADNRWLLEAHENQIPIIYFIGIAPGRYQAIIPAYVTGWDAASLKARIAFGVQDDLEYAIPDFAADRRYAMREVQQRLHQGSFREAVIHAYDGRCAISGLPETRLLDAAHIIPDPDERFGQPVVVNGLPLSKIHHAAFDAHLIGIDPDYRIHVSDQLLSQDDGPLLNGLKDLNRSQIRLPRRPRDHPDRERLARRFDAFQAAN